MDDELKKIALGDGHNQGNPRKLLDIIGLNDKPLGDGTDEL